MRSLTTDWNNASYASAASFVDVISGNYITIAANEPTKTRSFTDSVNSGQYATLAATAVPATMTNDSVANAVAVDVDATADIVVNVAGSALAAPGVRVTATSSDLTKATVSPAKGLTDASGNVTFTVTGVAAGASNIVIKVASNVAITNTVVATAS